MPWWKKWEPEIEREIGYASAWHEVKALYPQLKVDAMVDTFYRIPSDPLDLLNRFPHKNLPYIKNKRDCDKFVHGFKWWLAKIGHGDLLVMDIKIKVPTLGSHRVVGFLHKGEIVIGNPQGGKIADYPDYKILRIFV